MLTYSILINLEPSKAQDVRRTASLVSYARRIVNEFRFPAPSTHNISWGTQDAISIIWVTGSDGKVLYGNLVGGLQRADAAPERRRHFSVVSIEKGQRWGDEVSSTKLPPSKASFSKPVPSTSTSSTSASTFLRYSILIEVVPERAATLTHPSPPIPWIQATLYSYKFPPSRAKNIQWENETTLSCAWETESNGKVLCDNLLASIDRARAQEAEREQCGIVRIVPGPDWGVRVSRDIRSSDSVSLGTHAINANTADTGFYARDERRGGEERREDDVSYRGGESSRRSMYGPRGEGPRDGDDPSFYSRSAPSIYERPRSPPLSYERPVPSSSDATSSHRSSQSIHPSRLALISSTPDVSHEHTTSRSVYPPPSPTENTASRSVYPPPAPTESTASRSIYPPPASTSRPPSSGYREPPRTYSFESHRDSYTPLPTSSTSFPTPPARPHSPDPDFRRRLQRLSDELSDSEAARRRLEVHLLNAEQSELRAKREVEERVADARRMLLDERDSAMFEAGQLRSELAEVREAHEREVRELREKVDEVEKQRDEVKRILDALSVGSGRKERQAEVERMDDEVGVEGTKALKDLALKLQHDLASERALREAIEEQLKAELKHLKEELFAASRTAEDESERCREADRRARAAVRRADIADRERRVAEKERSDMERELKGRGVLPAVLEAMKQISRMAAETEMGEGDEI